MSMKKVFAICLAITVMVTAWGGSVAGLGNSSQKPGSEQATEFTDPARPITVSPGEKFVIVIASNRTTGFSWQVAKPLDEKVIKLVGSGYLPSKVDLDGAGGKEVWTFIAVAEGRTAIQLKYVRPWEKDKAPLQEATFTVIVR
jgi:inhibitor of cysteine peptidase